MYELIMYLWPILTSAGAFGLAYWIARDFESRRKLGGVISEGILWPHLGGAARVLFEWCRNKLGRPFSIRSLNKSVAITYFAIVLSLAGSEMEGSAFVVGDAYLLGRKLPQMGSILFFAIFAAVLGPTILLTWNRSRAVRTIGNITSCSDSSMVRAKMIYWTLMALFWSISGFLVWIVATPPLFKACLVVGSLSVIGSISWKTRLLAVIGSVIIAIVLVLRIPLSAVAHILTFLNIIVGPIVALWLWLTMGVVSLLLNDLTTTSLTRKRLLCHVILSLVFGVIGLLGVSFSLALSFRGVNGVLGGFGVPEINWPQFYLASELSPLGAGLFFSAVVIVVVSPAILYAMFSSSYLLAAPIPGSRKVSLLCFEPELSSLDLARLSAYLWFTTAVQLLGLVLILWGSVDLLFRIGAPVFIATLELVRQLP